MCSCNKTSCNGISCLSNDVRAQIELAAGAASADAVNQTLMLTATRIQRGESPLAVLSEYGAQAAATSAAARQSLSSIRAGSRLAAPQPLALRSDRAPDSSRNGCGGQTSSLAEHSCFQWPCREFPAAWFSIGRETNRPTGRYRARGSDYASFTNLAAFQRVVQRLCEASVQVEMAPEVFTGGGTPTTYTLSGRSVTGAPYPAPYMAGMGLIGLEIAYKINAESITAPKLTITVGSPSGGFGWDIMPYESYPREPEYALPSSGVGPVGRIINVELDGPEYRGSIFIPFGFRPPVGTDSARPVYARVSEYTLEDGGGNFTGTISGSTADYTFEIKPITSESESLANMLEALEYYVRAQ